MTDDPAPSENVTVNGSVGTPNGTLGDLPNVSTDPGDGGSTPDDSDDGTSDSNPNVGTGDGDGEGEPQPKVDLDCGFASRTASGGYACVGDQTDSNDDSSTGATPRRAATTPTARPPGPAAIRKAWPATAETETVSPTLASPMLAVAAVAAVEAPVVGVPVEAAVPAVGRSEAGAPAATVPAGTVTPALSAPECNRRTAAILISFPH